MPRAFFVDASREPLESRRPFGTTKGGLPFSDAPAVLEVGVETAAVECLASRTGKHDALPPVKNVITIPSPEGPQRPATKVYILIHRFWR